MKFEVLINDKENSFKKILEKEINNKPKKIYVFSGMVKEGGYDIFEEIVYDITSPIYMYIGVDKKNTTKKMLENMLKLTKQLYVYTNNANFDYDASMYIFEYSNKAVIYQGSFNMSESGFIDNLNTISKIEYDLENEKKEYTENLKTLKNLKDKFKLVNKEVIENMLEQKQIFTQSQYNHSTLSISEFLGKSKEVKNNVKVNVFDNIPKMDLDDTDIDIEIDIDEIQDIKEKKEIIKDKVKTKKDNNENNKNKVKKDKGIDKKFFTENMDEALDLGNMLLVESDLELSEYKEEANKKGTKNIVDLTNVSNFIFEISEKDIKLNAFRLPKYIMNLIPNFFNMDVKAINGEKENRRGRDEKIFLLLWRRNKRRRNKLLWQ